MLPVLPSVVSHIGMGLIEAKTEFLQKILVPEEDIAKYYDVEQIPFARWEFEAISYVCIPFWIFFSCVAIIKPKFSEIHSFKLLGRNTFK